MEPITLIVSALVAGIAAAARPVAEQGLKDAYVGLKKIIQDRYTISLSNLEEDPTSTAQKAAVVESLSKKQAQDDLELVEQAKVVVEAVQRTNPGVAETVAVDLNRVKVGIATFQNLKANSGATGVRATDSKFDQLNFGDVEAGIDPKE
jgi:hypothetical protein